MSSNSEKPQSKGVIGALAATNANTADRRRSSGGASAQKFASLQNQKRTSQDASAAARRQSFAEQQAQPGFIGGLWNKFTKG